MACCEVIAFGGRIASGKSTISRLVASRLDAPWVSFGDAVRMEARDRGIPTSRINLQDLGDELIAQGWDEFCELVVRQAPADRRDRLVVDGVRHLGAIDALSRWSAPARSVLIFVNTSRERRLGWLRERGVSEQAALAADSHQNESELDAVETRADGHIENDGPVDDAVEAALAALTAIGMAPR